MEASDLPRCVAERRQATAVSLAAFNRPALSASSDFSYLVELACVGKSGRITTTAFQ